MVCSKTFLSIELAQRSDLHAEVVLMLHIAMHTESDICCKRYTCFVNPTRPEAHIQIPWAAAVPSGNRQSNGGGANNIETNSRKLTRTHAPERTNIKSADATSRNAGSDLLQRSEVASIYLVAVSNVAPLCFNVYKQMRNSKV